MNDELVLLREFERLVAEGGKDFAPSAPVAEQYKYYNCANNAHKWKWYVGAHMDKFWYCELCDLKDHTREFPKY